LVRRAALGVERSVVEVVACKWKIVGCGGSNARAEPVVAFDPPGALSKIELKIKKTGNH